MDLTGIFNSGAHGIIAIAIYLLTFTLPLTMGIYLLKNFLKAPSRRPFDFNYGDPEVKFAIIVPARNEDPVISKTVKQLKKQNYPSDMFDVVIIADNCTDLTAQKAKGSGAIVLERDDPNERSKAYALKWFFESDFLEKGGYDSVCIVDADTVLSPNFLREIDREMAKGHPIVYGRSGSINPFDSVTSSFMTLLLSVQNRIWHLPQSNIGRSGFFAGTGVCIKVECLGKIGWNIHTLVEDAEFSIQAVLKGCTVKYCDHALFYVEQVKSFSQLWKQQRRWRTGHISCLKIYGKKLAKEVLIKKNKDAIAGFFLVMIPPFCIIALFQFIFAPLLLLFVFGPDFFDPIAIALAFLLQFTGNFLMHSLFLMIDQRFSFRHWKGISAMFFAPFFYGILDITCLIRPIKEWDLMEHGDTDYDHDAICREHKK